MAMRRTSSDESMILAIQKFGLDVKFRNGMYSEITRLTSRMKGRTLFIQNEGIRLEDSTVELIGLFKSEKKNPVTVKAVENYAGRREGITT